MSLITLLCVTKEFSSNAIICGNLNKYKYFIKITNSGDFIPGVLIFNKICKSNLETKQIWIYLVYAKLLVDSIIYIVFC